MTFSIRRARPEDAVAIGRINMVTWQTSFKGVVPDSYLARRDPVQRAEVFRPLLDVAEHGFFVAEIGGAVVGFAEGGPRTEAGKEQEGDLKAVYVLYEHQRAGVGRALVRATVARLLERGFRNMIVWTLERSPYARFYEKLGGEKLEASRCERDFDGTKLNLIAYWYSDLAALAGRLADG